MALTERTGIQYLKGVGEKRAALYAKLRIFTVGDLIRHFPRDYIDLTSPHDIMSAPLSGEPCAVRARLTYKSREQRIRGGLSLFKLIAQDGEGGEMTITIFNAKYTVDGLCVDEEYVFYGKVAGGLLHREMAAPMIFSARAAGAVAPVYGATAGLSSNLIRSNIAQALRELPAPPDPLWEELREEYGLDALAGSLKSIHFPGSLAAAKIARDRFVFEELLVLCCALAGLHKAAEKLSVPPMTYVPLEAFYETLPFRPTNAQLRCVKEIAADLCSGTPMNRLVQGDVGSGKTLVAAAAIYFAHQNGMQSAMMAPTEILAEQHFVTLSRMLEPLGVRIALLTGSAKAAQRRLILQNLGDGLVDLCVGTHALLTRGVDFARLGLAVTDEQHRFGVAQRAALTEKKESCHVLVMSATPIPRTLSLIIYGDLALSTIDELPPGRMPVETLVIGSGKRERALGFLKKSLDEGRQAYIVCPLVEMGEIDTGLRPAVEYAAALAERELRGYRVGLLHGRMKPKEKEDVMRRFKEGAIQVLVSTTVVEVGVDVPNAAIIMVENAERFGLSQLHQLRGRVGRGRHKSWCILVSDARGENARARLSAMKTVSDGFKLAELDLQLRGPGDFFGERQHGLPELRVASLGDNLAVMRKAQECAARLLEEDPELLRPERALLRLEAERMRASVGERPN